MPKKALYLLCPAINLGKLELEFVRLFFELVLELLLQQGQSCAQLYKDSSDDQDLRHHRKQQIGLALPIHACADAMQTGAQCRKALA